MKPLHLTIYTPHDIIRAKNYWADIFSDHRPQLPEIHPECQLSIVVPVFDERLSRVRKQLASFAQQKVAQNSFEIIYIVNNAPPDGTQKWKDAFIKNQRVLAFLKTFSQLTVHVIDRSSPGREIKGCNVGKARNIAVAEASFRYYNQNRDGILFQTDADVYLGNKRHFYAILSAFRNDPLAIGAAGGVIYEIDPDTESTHERNEYLRSLKLIRMYFQWQTLLYELHNKNHVPPVYPTRFSGMHMISRAVATACVGGVLERNYAEDTHFGKALDAFAKKRGGHVLAKREQWYVTSALRESLRTEASFGNILTKIIQDKKVIVISEHAPQFRTFADHILRLLQQSPNIHAAQELLQYQNKNIRKLITNVQHAHGKTERYSAYRLWRIAHFKAKRGPIEQIYFKQYPHINLTKYRLNKLKKILHSDPVKYRHFENSVRHFQNFRLPK